MHHAEVKARNLYTKKIKKRYRSIKSFLQSIVYQGRTAYCKKNLKISLSQYRLFYKRRTIKSLKQKSLLRIYDNNQEDVREKLNFERVKNKNLKLSLEIWNGHGRNELRPDKIIQFYDCHFPLNHKYLISTDLLFGYKLFSKIKYYKTIESTSFIESDKQLLVQLASDVKLDSIAKKSQLDLLNDWLEETNLPEAHKLAVTLTNLRLKRTCVENFSILTHNKDKSSIQYLKKLNAATIRKINKFGYFSLVFSINLKRFTFDLEQIMISSGMCDLLRIDLNCNDLFEEEALNFLDN